MASKQLFVLLAAFASVCIVQVLASGYGHSYMVPGGGDKGRKWSIRARGKGMQNMMQMHYPHKEEKKEKEVVYYPVPVYSKKKPEYEHKMYESSYSSPYDYKKHQTSYDYSGYEKKSSYKPYDDKSHEYKGDEDMYNLSIVPIYGYHKDSHQ